MKHLAQHEVPEGYQPPAEKVDELRRLGMADSEIARRTERFILDRRAKGVLYARVDLAWWYWMTDRFSGKYTMYPVPQSPQEARSPSDPIFRMPSDPRDAYEAVEQFAGTFEKTGAWPFDFSVEEWREYVASAKAHPDGLAGVGSFEEWRMGR